MSPEDSIKKSPSKIRAQRDIECELGATRSNARGHSKRVLGIALGCAVLFGCNEGKSTQPIARIDWGEVTEAIRSEILERARKAAFARADGYVYTVDIAQMMEAAVSLDDAVVYDALRPYADAARVDASDTPFVRGFVAWRVKTGTPADASGTTEAIRLARALWFGSIAFDRPADRALSLELVDGYQRHSYVDQGVWLIRNYYNLQTGAFANNSFLVDYDADFLHVLSQSESRWSSLSNRVDTLLSTAMTKTGLVHELVQPEIATAMPEVGTAVFSPNRLAQLSNSCAVLERALAAHRADAQRLFEFAAARSDDLGLIFDVKTGERHERGSPGVETYGCLIRLGYRLGVPERTRVFETKIRWFVQEFLNGNSEPASFIASELLLTAAAVLENP